MLPPCVVDIDSNDKKTSEYDPTYAYSIYKEKRRMEVRYQQKSPHICLGVIGCSDGIQTDITAAMRVTLLDWLVHIADDYRLYSSTYHLAVQLMDHALSLINVKRSQFQLLGCACLWLASKLEEAIPPQVENLVYVADCCFDAEQLVNYEQRLMRIFEYRPAMPTRLYFVLRFVKAAEATPREIALAQYLVELSLYDVRYLQHRMSLVAAAAVHLALQMLRPLTSNAKDEQGRNTEPYQIWTPTLQHYTDYKETDLVHVVHRLNKGFTMIETSDCNFVQHKYEKLVWHKVAQLMALPPSGVRFDDASAQRMWTAICVGGEDSSAWSVEGLKNNIANKERNSAGASAGISSSSGKAMHGVHGETQAYVGAPLPLRASSVQAASSSAAHAAADAASHVDITKGLQREREPMDAFKRMGMAASQTQAARKVNKQLPAEASAAAVAKRSAVGARKAAANPKPQSQSTAQPTASTASGQARALRTTTTASTDTLTANSTGLTSSSSSLAITATAAVKNNITNPGDIANARKLSSSRVGAKRTAAAMSSSAESSTATRVQAQAQAKPQIEVQIQAHGASGCKEPPVASSGFPRKKARNSSTSAASGSVGVGATDGAGMKENVAASTSFA